MIRDILNNLRNGPTILTLDQIQTIMTSLQSLNAEEILNNEEKFLEILDLLCESYSDSAIFEVNTDNKPLLERFNNWLLDLGNKHPIGKNQDDLNSYADIFFKEFNKD